MSSSKKPLQAGGHLGLGCLSVPAMRRKLPVAWLHIMGSFKSGIVDCSIHLGSALVVGPLVWVASLQEIKLSCLNKLVSPDLEDIILFPGCFKLSGISAKVVTYKLVGVMLLELNMPS